MEAHCPGCEIPLNRIDQDHQHCEKCGRTFRCCPKCGSISLRHESDMDGEYLKCWSCSKTIYLDPIPTKPVIPYEPDEEPKRPTSSGMSAQKRAQRRYRQSDLFKLTNKRIQERYRRSPKGQQVLLDQRSRSRILRKLVKTTSENRPICERHNRPVSIIKDGVNLCIDCLKEREWKL